MCQPFGERTHTHEIATIIQVFGLKIWRGHCAISGCTDLPNKRKINKNSGQKFCQF